ncbi:hypothetical protein LXL04_014097 [Taraxacum kok-saghyz]
MSSVDSGEGNVSSSSSDRLVLDWVSSLSESVASAIVILTSIGSPGLLLKGCHITSTSLMPMIRCLPSWMIRISSLIIFLLLLPIAVKFSMHRKFTGSPITFTHASLSNSSIETFPSFSTLNHLRHVDTSSRNHFAASGSSNLIVTLSPPV